MRTTTKDAELCAAFEAHEIDAATFHHEQHIRVAYLLLKKRGFLETLSIYTKGIQTIAAKAGANEKFNLTLTLAYHSIVAERTTNTSTHSCDDFMMNNKDLLDPALLNKIYDAKRLNSQLAKQVFLLP